MLTDLERAVCAALAALPGVATARPYAGELDGSARAALRVPALLVALTRATLQPDPGTGEILARVGVSVFACTRHADTSEIRGRAAWDLVETVLLAVRGQTWGLPGVSPALLGAPLDALAQPLWSLEDKGLAVREVRWTHDVRLGESVWVGGDAPTEVWLGIAPKIGAAHVEDYVQIAFEPVP